MSKVKITKKGQEAQEDPELQSFSAKAGLPDMISLDVLTEQSLLENLRVRYARDEIYTYTGNILVAVNPYQVLPLYSPEIMKSYMGAKFGENPPHLYAIADMAYRAMMDDHVNQSILVSGESGAGKTESTKLMLQFLSSVSTRHSMIEQQILEANPILEAFGNAKTLRNDNSSRFGKFINIGFDDSGSIIGAYMEEYLLERARLVYQAQNERNYHIFYQMMSGATREELARWKINPSSSYVYVDMGKCRKVDSINDVEDYRAMCMAMGVLGFGDLERDQILDVVAACIHLGNITYKAVTAEKCQFADNASIEHADVAASLLKIDPATFRLALLERENVIRGELFHVPYNQMQAEVARDSVTKAVYGRMFSWLVKKINDSIKATDEKKIRNTIGILDIFGFEKFDVNSFEQLCINYTNEKLQQFFNQHIFKLEQVEYEREGVDWTNIEFKDNQETVDLIEKKPIGIIALLDEECRMPKASDGTFVAKLHERLCTHPSYTKSKLNAATRFGVIHYAGEVEYTNTGFLDKNADKMEENMERVLFKSKIKLVSALFEPAGDKGVDKDGKAKAVGIKTVGNQFKESLIALMVTLSTTTPYFVRCIKPNYQKAKRVFDDDLVVRQLKYSGMLETIRIRKMGYPIRRVFKEFLFRYRALSKLSLANMSVSQACAELVKQYGVNDFHIGKTKFFLRDKEARSLENKRSDAVNAVARKLQWWMRACICKIKYRRILKGIMRFQACYRMHKARMAYLKKRNAAIKVEALVRRFVQRCRYLRTLKVLTRVQATVKAKHQRRQYINYRNKVIFAEKMVRGHVYKKRFATMKIAALKMQSLVRMWVYRKHFLARIRKIRKLQATWRMVSARRAYQKQRKAAIVIQHAVHRHCGLTIHRRTMKQLVKGQTRVKMYLAKKKLKKLRADKAKSEALRKLEDEAEAEERKLLEAERAQNKERLREVQKRRAEEAAKMKKASKLSKAAALTAYRQYETELSNLINVEIEHADALDKDNKVILKKINIENNRLRRILQDRKNQETRILGGEAKRRVNRGAFADKNMDPILQYVQIIKNIEVPDEIENCITIYNNEVSSQQDVNSLKKKEIQLKRMIVIEKARIAAELAALEEDDDNKDNSTNGNESAVEFSMMTDAIKSTLKYETSITSISTKRSPYATSGSMKYDAAVDSVTKVLKSLMSPEAKAAYFDFPKWKPSTVPILPLKSAHFQHVVKQTSASLFSYMSNPTYAELSTVLTKSLSNPAIRDEMYVQILWSILGNQIENGWVALQSMAACCVPCTKEIGHCVIRLAASTSNLCGRDVVSLLQRQSLFPDRVMAPCPYEIACAKTHSTIILQLHLPDRSILPVVVDSVTTASELMSCLQEHYNITDTSGWTLLARMHAKQSAQHILAPGDRICDALAATAKLRLDTKTTPDYDDDPIVMSGLTLQLIKVRHPLPYSKVTDEFTKKQWYQQARFEHDEGRYETLTAEQQVALAALLIKAETSVTNFTEEFVSTVFPNHLLNSLDRVELLALLNAAAEPIKNLTPAEARQKFMEEIAVYPMSNSLVINAEARSGPKVFVAIGTDSLCIYDIGREYVQVPFYTISQVGFTGKSFDLQQENVVIQQRDGTIIALRSVQAYDLYYLVNSAIELALVTSSTAVAVEDYALDDKRLLGFKAGTIIKLRAKDDRNWFSGCVGDKVGWFPGTKIRVIFGPSDESARLVLEEYKNRSNPVIKTTDVFTAKIAADQQKKAAIDSAIAAKIAAPTTQKPLSRPSSASRQKPPASTAPKPVVPVAVPKPGETPKLAVAPVAPKPTAPTASSAAASKPVVPAAPKPAEAPAAVVKPPPEPSLVPAPVMANVVQHVMARRIEPPNFVLADVKKFCRDNFSSEALSFESTLLKKALLNKTPEAEQEEALKMNQVIMTYMGDYAMSLTQDQLLTALCKSMLNGTDTLRDDILFQIMKQINANPHPDSSIRGMEVMAFCLGIAPPSSSVQMVIRTFVYKARTLPGRAGELGDIAFANLRNISNGPRKTLPIPMEHRLVRGSVPMFVDVVLDDGRAIKVPVDMAMTIKELIFSLYHLLNLTRANGYGIVYKYYIPNPESTEQNPLPPFRVSKVAKSAMHLMDIMSQSTSINLIFTKCLPGFVDIPLLRLSLRRRFVEDFFPLTETEVNELSAAFALMDNIPPIPEVIRQHASVLTHPKYATLGWESRVAACMSRMIPPAAWPMILTKLSNNILFDAMMFKVVNKHSQDLPRDMVLAVTPTKLYFLDFEKKILKELLITDLAAYSGNEKTIAMTVGAGYDRKQMLFECMDGADIADVITMMTKLPKNR